MTLTLEETLTCYPGAESLRFGDSASMSVRLPASMREGRKKPTCKHLTDVDDGVLPLEVGRRDIAPKFDGTPALVIETPELVETTFQNMKVETGLAEGEDDSLTGWQRDHNGCLRRHENYAQEMPLIWDRLLVIDDFEDAG